MYAWLERTWFDAPARGVVLWPLAGLYIAITAVRRALYRWGVLGSGHPGRPVIVVGNLTVGGSGKTPLTIWLAQELAARGYRVGIVSRGYGGRNPGPVHVRVGSDPREVGDEPVLMAGRTSARIVVARDRLAGARMLAPEVDVIIADDGLQHYRLRRDFEIAVIDGVRRFGNGWRLPAGPLRESRARLASVDARVVNGGTAQAGEIPMRVEPVAWVDVGTGSRAEPSAWQGRVVHAVAAIGHPERFFSHLRALGLTVIPHPLRDHAAITAADLRFNDAYPVVMTEKDAVKCDFVPSRPTAYLEVAARLEAESATRLLSPILRLLTGG
jgi:tetraacyldisaccharide 4'-kinase